MVENLKILILEDDQNDADLLLHELKKSGLIYTSEIVQTRKAFESALESFKPDIILADYSLPSFDGVTAFNIKQNTSPDIPFIIVSGVIGDEKAVELIKNGVTDYALKDKLFVLIPKINRALKEAEKKKEKRIADEELVFQNEEKGKLVAELILANKKLNQSAELLQENLKEISDYKYALDESSIITITDQKGIIKKVNSNFCKISKYSEEELIGQDHRIINSGYHTKEFIRDLWVTIANGKIWRGEFKNKAKDGIFYWVDTTIVPFLDEEGKPYQYLAIRADITDRKEAEENLIQRTAQLGTANKELVFQYEEKEKLAAELIIVNKELVFQNEEREEQFKAIFNDAPIGIAIIDSLTGNIFNVNPMFAKIAGRTIAEMANIVGMGITHPDDIQLDLNNMAQLLAGEINGFRMEKRYIHPDGSFVWINMTISKILYHNKSHPRHLSMIEDITKSKKAEQAIKESEEKYRTLVEQASDAIFITDTTGRFITVNTSACKLSQYSEKELLQMTIYDFAITEDLQKNPFHFDELKQGKTVINERVMNRNNGIRLNVETTSKLLPDGKLLVFVRDISERKKAQNEIIKEKNLSDSIINSLPGIFYLSNMEGKFLRWNKNFETESKYSAEEIREMHPLDFFDEDEKEMVSRKIQNVFISGEETVQAKFLLKTKEKIPYYFTGIAISYEGVPCLMGVGIDFSELKKTQQALAENENRLRVILQTNPECIELTDINGELEAMNPAGLAMIEADSFEQIKGKSLLDVVDKPYWKAFSQLTQNVFEGISGKLEFEITGLKGTHRWMETHAVPLKDAKGKLISLLGITRDITERKKTEKEILRVIERYDMIAKATSDTIWDWDITNDKILYNEGIINMFGYEKAKVENIAGWWKTKIHPDDLQIVLKTVAAAFKKQSYNLQLEYRFRCADESFKYIYDRAFIIYDEHKKPCKMIGAMQDVSKLKKNEISLIELNENLQKQTKELSISNEELEGRNQVLQDIAWTQSHIVRAPLARMMGIVSIIKDLRVELPDYEEWINHFTTSANELDNIIKDIVNKTDNTKLDKF